MVKTPKDSLAEATKATARRRSSESRKKERRKVNAGAQETQAKIDLCRFDLRAGFLRLLVPVHQVPPQWGGQMDCYKSRKSKRTLH